jgi:hypothetical protein
LVSSGETTLTASSAARAGKTSVLKSDFKLKRRRAAAPSSS